jgi:hypothetical protein
MVMAKTAGKASNPKKKRITKPSTAKNKHVWFIPVRGSYLPASKTGWLLWLLFLEYLIFSALYGLKYADKISVAVVFILYNWLAATIFMTWLAARNS